MSKRLVQRVPVRTRQGLGEYQLWLVDVDGQTGAVKAQPQQIEWVWVGLFGLGLLVLSRR